MMLSSSGLTRRTNLEIQFQLLCPSDPIQPLHSTRRIHMDIGIPKQKRPFDYRIGLTPMGVKILTDLGHRCYVESGAGQGSGFDDERYRQAGAQIVYATEEIYGRGQLILSVSRPTPAEFELLQEGHILCGFLHLAVSHPAKIEILLERQVAAIAYETIQTADGHLPVLSVASQIAGRMIAPIAAQLLQNNSGGHGILLGGVPGVPPANVVILGAGMVGSNAAKMFKAMGTTVYVLDTDLHKLQQVEESGCNAHTIVAYDFNIAKAVQRADVLVGAVLIPGARTPIVVTREMVRAMKPRSVIMDISIDQGGCVETSHPTTYQSPTYIEEGVIHYCVPNMTGVVARTMTHAFNNAAWPYILKIAEQGLERALADDPALRHGLNTHDGQIVHPALRESLGGAA
ncbi:MAG: alanine dehydrogenase [Chloroflexi bacterium HGW-Chloroflexi-1]|nr:MAG: alanine dehydrogenase [Chloroflexi bacterium HGW-Chloroflexi-1]